MQRIHLLPAIPALAVLASDPALAEPIPVDQFACNHAEITPVLSVEGMTLVSWSIKGIIVDESERGEPDVSEYCVGTTLNHGDRRIARGYCTLMYPEGDQILVEVSREGEGAGTWRFVDGTGKYQGVTGEGSYRFVTEARPVQEGTWQYCTKNDGSYTLQE